MKLIKTNTVFIVSCLSNSLKIVDTKSKQSNSQSTLEPFYKFNFGESCSKTEDDFLKFIEKITMYFYDKVLVDKPLVVLASTEDINCIKKVFGKTQFDANWVNDRIGLFPNFNMVYIKPPVLTNLQSNPIKLDLNIKTNNTTDKTNLQFKQFIPNEIQTASLILFNSFVVADDEISYNNDDFYTNEKLSKYGLIFHKLLKNEEETFLKTYMEVFPIDKVNNTFWDFYSTIKHEEDGTRKFYQFVHYLTTYGAEAFGVNVDTFIPNEKYGKEIEGIAKSTKIISVISLTKLSDKIRELLLADYGYSNQQIEAIMQIVEFLHSQNLISQKELLLSKNRDLLVRICKKFSLYPFNFDLFLAYLFAENFNARKIKSKSFIKSINQSPNSFTFVEALEKYLAIYGEDGLKEMARCFRRNKEILLSIKTNQMYEVPKNLRKAINKAKKLSDRGFHKPVHIMNITDYEYKQYKDLLEKSKTKDIVKYYIYFQKVKNSIRGFFIRNGSIWVDNEPVRVFTQKDEDFLKMTEEKLRERIESIFKGTKVHPQHRIAIPTSATQFIGNVPLLSQYIFDPESEKYPLAGIHWFNYYESEYINERVDLDLHSVNFGLSFEEAKHIGWNSDWRDGGDCVFSGDMTDAPKPNGAAEYMLFTSDFKFICFLSVADYTQFVFNKPDFTFSLILGGKSEFNVKKGDITLDDVSVIIPTNFKTKVQQSLGFYFGRKFILANFAMTSNRVVADMDMYKDMAKFVIKLSNEAVPYLNDFLDSDDENGLTLDNLTTDYWSTFFKK